MTHIEDYLHLNRKALDELPPAERIAVLADLAQRANKWLADARSEEIDRLRSELGGDQAVAEALGISRQTLADLGDGPAVQLGNGAWARPRLLKRGCELLLNYLPPSSQPRDVFQALEILSRRGRPDPKQLQAAAHRLARSARLSPTLGNEMPQDEMRVLVRALTHAAEISSQ
ncbi:hypothetical protein [Kutzneria albida]|uniref:Uncharacterized protein n=1 Tax=Kutzneria albida DSM 43870 TaxID=1449976 RepID=W5WBZ5_9PSEU|nr:hypothetical protein [Kutzneria albida]AHH98275.1 hypothetical protein KALB_4913 [Kutzneria albida DSM 43870]